MTLYLFPLNFAFNSFSLSLLVVVAGLSGHHSMAADLSLAQAAMIALFFSFSANARNLILKSSDGAIEKSIVQMRLLSAPVLAVAALAVSVYLSKVGLLVSVAIVIRQISEWFSEIELSRLERLAEYDQAKLFLAGFSLPLLCAIATLLFAPSFFLLSLYFWALLPLVFCFNGIVGSVATISSISIEWRRILPNYGSTFIIGMVVFFFRLLIAGFAGKEVAGQLFTAFALGSIVGSLYERTIGPSFKVSAELARNSSFIFRLAWLLPLAGTGLILLVYFLGETSNYLAKNIYLIGATGFSLVGGFVMLAAQTIKINILHSKTRDDVFMADLLSNFAILVSVPAAFLLFGEASFVVLFFTNAVLVYVCYWLISGPALLIHTPKTEKLLHSLTAFAVVVPVFIQLGSGIYRGHLEVYDWGGRLSMMPLPLSVFLCFPLILVMHSFRGFKTFAVFSFVIFTAMMCGTVVSSPHDPVAIKNKLLLSIQYLLPFFGLVLAEHAGASESFLKGMAKVFLSVVVGVVALQLLVSFSSGAMRLVPYLYLFSIYNNSQYASVIFVSAFLLGLFVLYETAEYKVRRTLLMIVPLMCLYAALSLSILVFCLICGGLFLFWVTSRFNRWIGLSVLTGILICALVWRVGPLNKKGGALPKEGTCATIGFRTITVDLGEKYLAWDFYINGMLAADTKAVVFGHSVVPQRKLYPSAHNYYLDVLYNFGLITLLPILLLVVYTAWLAWIMRKDVLNSTTLSGFTFVVFFLVFIENSFKVGFRQPYSGIYSFFLWGLFINTLRGRATEEVPKAFMRIAILNLTGGGISGGNRKYLANILAKFNEAPEFKSILCASPSSVNVRALAPAADKISFIECAPFTPFIHAPSAPLKDALDSFNPDFLFIPIERYVRYKGKPVIVMLQNMAPLTGAKTGTGLKEFFVSIVRRYETRYALKRAAAVIVPTGYVRDFLMDREGVPGSKIFVVPYGSTPVPAVPKKPVMLPPMVDKFIFTAGSLEIYRGIEDLIRALPAVKESIPGIKLVVAGGVRAATIEYLEGVKKLACSLGVEKDVAFLGNISEAELSWCYSNCSVFALTSRVESFCFVALEAMAHGRRIVSTDSPCLPEVIGDAGVYYKPGDSASLGGLLVSELSARHPVPDARALHRAASFSWERTSAQTMAVFARTLGRP